jgi:hypothetical protein
MLDDFYDRNNFWRLFFRGGKSAELNPFSTVSQDNKTHYIEKTVGQAKIPEEAGDLSLLPLSQNLQLGPGKKTALGVKNFDLYGATAVQAVGGAAQSGIVGAHRHFDLI